MVDSKTNPIPGLGASERIAARATPAPSATDSAAFRALLERLEREAHALEQDVQRAPEPKALAGVVDRAHASMQDALSLGDRLLEAYRAALAQEKAPDAAAARSWGTEAPAALLEGRGRPTDPTSETPR